MDISGLNINGGAVMRPSQPKRQVRQRTFESKCDDSEGKERTATRNNAAAMQRKKDGVDESRYILDKGSSDCSHDSRRFGYRQQLECEKENAREACGVSRAKYWSTEVENAFRIQSGGWRDIYEYINTHGQPEIWLSNGLISKIYVKKTGFITYWSESRECPDNKLHLVKLFKYKDSKKGRASKK